MSYIDPRMVQAEIDYRVERAAAGASARRGRRAATRIPFLDAGEVAEAGSARRARWTGRRH
ncbi:hypothetical protein [Nocardioides sp.]|uniref:hypothetical protein n=1 Tax=Nocardioides sp. TaxID=35761 RepID=UPI003514A502